MDTLSVKKRSWNMSRICSVNTQPELLVRSYLHRKGFRFSLHRTDISGKPDIVLPKYRSLIFVHGCFWHKHGCAKSHIPKSNRNYWMPKLKRNVHRFEITKRELQKEGWRVIVVWECEAKKISTYGRITKRIINHVRKRTL